MVAACVLATLYLGAGNWETVQRFFGEHLRTNPAPAGTCPAKVARSISGDGPVNLVAAYRTSQHDVIICRTGTSRFYYHGEVTGNPGSAMDLPARKTAKGYLAVNGSYTYEVRGRRIIVSRSGQVIGDYRGRPFKP
ncbi:hypothetical protein [Actinomadura macrotermitis]|uniref:hypothetical protein n=1 Tax=Actinomadura macrotermitis TaxID=2585200 RepID=UPI001295C1C4|nr:hypothetical protein [Actinomadura macrotermitis]